MKVEFLGFVVLDVKKKKLGSHYELYIHNGTKSTGIDPIHFAIEMQKSGAGEIVVNSIDQDGVMSGYDLNLINKIREVINIPMTVMGGAGTMEDIGSVVQQHGIIGVAAGSLFVFKGKYRAVLINYPTPNEKAALLKKHFLNIL